MLQSAVGVDHVDGVYWTLWTELRFYLLLGVLSLVGITRRRVVGVAILWPWAALLAEHAGATGLATAADRRLRAAVRRRDGAVRAHPGPGGR